MNGWGSGQPALPPPQVLSRGALPLPTAIGVGLRSRARGATDTDGDGQGERSAKSAKVLGPEIPKHHGDQSNGAAKP